MATRRVEAPSQTKTAPLFVARRRIVHPAAAPKAKSLLELRLRGNHDGRIVRQLTLVHEYTRQCVAIRVARWLNSYHVIETLGNACLQHGVPERGDRTMGGDDSGTSEAVTSDFRNQAVVLSSRAASGKTDNANPLTASCATSVSTEKCYIRFEKRRRSFVCGACYNTKRLHNSLGYGPPAPVT
jgi:hypothetical protein